MYAAADGGHVTLLCLLDLSSAFDTVDPAILLQRLRHKYGLRTPVLDWFRTYLTGRSQSVCYNGQMSAAATLRFGVPQGSVLGPNLFVLYTAEVIAIAEQHGFVVHAYADDLQLYDYDDPSSCASLVSRLSACVDCSSIRTKRNSSGLVQLGTLGCAQLARSQSQARRSHRH